MGVKLKTLSSTWAKFAALACFTCTQAYAESKVDISIRETSRPGGSESLSVDVAFANHGDEPAFLYRLETPFGRLDDGLSSDQFLITDASGSAIPNVGSTAHGGRLRLAHFTVIQPGESMHKEVDLGKEYDFRDGGNFKVVYFLRLDRTPDDDEAPPEEHRAFLRSSQAFVQSNEIVVHVGPRLLSDSLLSSEEQ